MCCDFWNWIAQTVKDAFSLRRIDECSAELGNARFFTTLDMASAFSQMGLRPGDEYTTAFVCKQGLFQCVMPLNFPASDDYLSEGHTATLWKTSPMLHRRHSDSNFLVGRPLVSASLGRRSHPENQMKIEFKEMRSFESVRENRRQDCESGRRPTGPGASSRCSCLENAA